MFVGVVAVPACWDSGLVTVLDVLRGANAARQQVDPDIPEIRVCTVGAGPDPVRTAGGLLVPIDVSVDDEQMSALDLLVVPALAANTPHGVVDALQRPELQAVRRALRDRTEARRPVAAACTGTFVLADAGVLDSRCATTSWWLADEFHRRYPRVALDMSRMVITDGTIITAGAAFAHIDLAMHVVASVSPQLADAVAAALLFDERPAPSVHAAHSYLETADQLVVDFETWVRDNLERAISVPEAAHAIGTTRRTLERRVREHVGITPYALIQRLRVERARHLRRTTSLPMSQIAVKVGYRGAATLRGPMRAAERNLVEPSAPLPGESLH